MFSPQISKPGCGWKYQAPSLNACFLGCLQCKTLKYWLWTNLVVTSQSSLFQLLTNNAYTIRRSRHSHTFRRDSGMNTLASRHLHFWTDSSNLFAVEADANSKCQFKTKQSRTTQQKKCLSSVQLRPDWLLCDCRRRPLAVSRQTRSSNE